MNSSCTYHSPGCTSSFGCLVGIASWWSRSSRCQGRTGFLGCDLNLSLSLCNRLTMKFWLQVLCFPLLCMPAAWFSSPLSERLNVRGSIHTLCFFFSFTVHKKKGTFVAIPHSGYFHAEKKKKKKMLLVQI